MAGNKITKFSGLHLHNSYRSWNLSGGMDHQYVLTPSSWSRCPWMKTRKMPSSIVVACVVCRHVRRISPAPEAPISLPTTETLHLEPALRLLFLVSCFNRPTSL